MEAADRTRRIDLEARLSGDDILDCVVITRTTIHGHIRFVAYLVPTPATDAARLKRRIEAESLAAQHPVVPVLVNQIPRTAEGTPDLPALLRLPVLTPQALHDFDLMLRQRWPDGRFQVDLAPDSIPRTRVHVSAIDRTWRAVETEALPVASLPAETESAPGAALPPALCDGGPLRVAPDDPRTLPAALLRAAEQFPDHGLHVVVDRQQTHFIAYPDLLARARRILGGLREQGLQAGDVAILHIPTLADHFPAFWACVLGGIRPVTIARPPGYGARNAVLDKLYHAWLSLARPVLISGGQTAADLRSLTGLYDMDGLRVLTVERCEQAPAAEELHQPDPADVAMLQLSSGSTGTSKVIQITHRGLMEYVLGDRDSTGFASGDLTFNWLPLDHVVPIVMFHLRPVFLGCTNLHAPAELILADPLLWLDLLERHRVNHTWAPNFGYKLITEALHRQPGRHWDLAALKTLLNAGEQCTLPVMRDFLTATAPFGISASKLVLAWGMAETCTAIVYKFFSDADSVQYVRTSSIRGALEWLAANAEPADQTIFLSMGRPAMGATLRVVDQRNHLLPEGWIGRLQVRSGRVTPGYLNHPEANRDAFPDGDWFNTGDLAFIKDGQVTITGREKELIIIGGNHYYCYDLEDAVSRIAGVKPSFVAACGVPTRTTGSEALVIFFVAEPSQQPDVLAIIRTIRDTLAVHFQTAPALVIPLAEASFPKTTSGKIQRSELKERLLRGEFDGIVRELDLREGNANTVPDCMYRVAWEAREYLADAALPQDGVTLVLSDEDGLADGLEHHRAHFGSLVRVGRASDYAEIGADRFHLDPAVPEHWDRLFRALREQNLLPQTVLYLWSYLPLPDPDLAGAALNNATARCGDALLMVIRALAKHVPSTPLRVVTVSRQLHRITGDEAICYPAAMTAALTLGLRHEYPHLDAWHLDLAGRSPRADADDLLAALWMRRSGAEIAWRDGRCYLRRLVKLTPRPHPEPSSLLRHGACYVVSGGLGGIGAELLADLLQRYQLNVLILGRTPLAEDKKALLDRLAARGGSVRYRAVDLTDTAGLEEAVREAEAAWQQPLDGVVHLAGGYELRLLADHDSSSWQRALASKLAGSLHLAALLRDRPQATFIAFSSLLSLIGATGSAAYSAANRVLEAVCDYLAAHTEIRTYCLSWGLW
ncbi:MAG TPA: SDR family NAD(P)-dependent oxidoreductase, partial [Herpetosiphonaceae bacterium]